MDFVGASYRLIRDYVRKEYIAYFFILYLIISGCIFTFNYPNKEWIVLVFVVVTIFILAFFLFVHMRNEQGNQINKIIRIAEHPFMITKNTIRILKRLDRDQVEEIRKIMEKAVRRAADILDCNRYNVRANIFAANKNGEYIMYNELTVNMNNEAERKIVIKRGEGCTGGCFSSGDVQIGTFKDNWKETKLAPEKMEVINPDLKWIITLPIKTKSKKKPIFVMNIDGIREYKEETELVLTAKSIMKYAYLIYQMIVSEFDDKERSDV